MGSENLREIYQKLYAPGSSYGRQQHNACPGTKCYKYYKDWLIDPIFDFGSGSGDTVRYLREKGHQADGMDWVECESGCFVGDITQPLGVSGFKTAISIDVFEHIADEDLKGLCKNMAQCERQIITVYDDHDIRDGIELHINMKTFDEWKSFLSEWFNIIHEQGLNAHRMLYVAEPHRED